MKEIIIAILASGALSAVISGLFNLLVIKKQRLTAEGEAINLLLWNELDGLCKKFISEGSISTEDLNRVLAMHKCYKKLGGNGYLDTLMSSVEKLPIK